MPLSPNPNIFANNPLDRVSHLRRDEAWLKAQLASADSLLALFQDGNPLVSQKAMSFETTWLSPAIITHLKSSSHPVFLGVDAKKRAYFALDIGRSSDATRDGLLQGLGMFMDLRQIAAGLPLDEAAILAQAKAMLHWQTRSLFCAATGEPLRMTDGGYRHVNKKDDLEYFPRTDVVVIMLASYGDEILLARQPRFPPRLYSAPAGFLEPGESIEEAVARELMEEVGIPVSSVTYFASQPWPFPASLMVGCFAKAESRDIVRDEEELEDARWFNAQDIEAAFRDEGSVRLPGVQAIGHHLIRHWLKSRM